MWGNSLSSTLTDFLFGWSGNPVFSTSPWSPFRSQLCIFYPGSVCHPYPEHCSPLGVNHQLPGEGRWESGQTGELCPSLLLVTLLRPINGICSPSHSSKSAFLKLKDENQGPEKQKLSTSAPSCPVFFQSFGSVPSLLEPFLFFFPFFFWVNKSLTFWASTQIRKEGDQGIAEFK